MLPFHQSSTSQPLRYSTDRPDLERTTAIKSTAKPKESAKQDSSSSSKYPNKFSQDYQYSDDKS